MKKKSVTIPGKRKPQSKLQHNNGKEKKSPVGENFAIVAIGASAGGVEASVELLGQLPPNLGFAYVFIHHLSPDYRSNLAEILQRQTSMPVVKVSSGLKLMPNHVYVIPPNRYMTVDDSKLKLRQRTKLDVPYHPVDYFLMSLANLRDNKAIGILLSGTATDGTLGLKALKGSGGITFAQDDTALHNQMSKNAQEAGFVDFVLSPKQIARELAALVEHPFSRHTSAEAVMKNEAEVRNILNVVLQRKGVDFFSHYKKSTIYRRIMRRMALHKIRTLKEYRAALKKDPPEVEALHHDLLINVTTFFREPAFYEALMKTAFPRIVEKLKSEEPIRIWIAGCATGEEAYSTAICLMEYLQKKRMHHPIHLFATDLSMRAIEKARLGIYSENLVQHISPQRLKKFFVKIDGDYQIIKSIREMCIFSAHDLLKDPPFSRIDLVSCQNVLIYLEPASQRKVFQSFHYALKPSGFLLMGKSESIGNSTDLFQPVTNDSRLHAKIPGIAPRLEFASDFSSKLRQALPPLSVARDQSDIDKESDKILLDRYVPGSVLVTSDLQIIRFRGSVSSFLEPASGKATLNLLKMLRDELLFDVRSALQRAKKTANVITRESVVGDRGKNKRSVTIEVSPVRSGKDTYYLIVFMEMREEASQGKTLKGARTADQKVKIDKLEHSLANARELIRATSEDFEAAREELQSANEEILSSNEELQSINEELETSKEELQASNEELTTINEELQNRNRELKQARDYAEAIIQTMRGPLMVLNAGMRLRTANRAFYDFFQMEPEHTEGALVYHLADGQWLPPSLHDRLREGFKRESDFNDFMVSHTFPAIGNRRLIINMHRLELSQNQNETLILVSFEDITRYKAAEENLLKTEEQLNLALAAGSVSTWHWDLKTNEVKLAGEQQKVYGVMPDISPRDYPQWEKMIHPEDLAPTREAFRRAIEKKVPLDVEFRIGWPDGTTHWVLAKANTWYDATGNPARMVGVNIDVTERQNAVQALEESEKRFHIMSDNAPVMIWMAGPGRQMNFLNRTWLSFTGRTLEQEVGDGWLQNIYPGDKNLFLDVFNRSFQDRHEFKIDYRLRRHDGGYRWVMTHGIPRFTGDQQFLGFIGTCIDIQDRIDLERQKDDFMSIASHELKTPVTSIKTYAQILHEKFRKVNDETSANMLARLDAQIDKLTGLINTLLDVARVQSGKMDYVEESFDIRNFVMEITEEMQRALDHHVITTHVHTNGKVFGDKTRIGQVLSNLLSNAAKYSPNATDIMVEVNMENDTCIFSVQDFGVGIPSDIQDKVFGRFFRVSEASGNRVSGLGLGLFIASQIIKQHGGKIWVESQPGKGSTFSFSLPLSNE